MPGPSYQYRAHVINVKDGDTVVLDIDLGFNTWSHDVTVRLYGIDAPEARSAAGKRARTYLSNYLPAWITVETIRNTLGREQQEKYGRWLGVLYVNDVRVNDRLVEKGHAVYWDGKGPRP